VKPSPLLPGRYDLVLYRGRSGGESFGYAGIMNAGAFSIQRLEGSRFGTVVLWVLNGREERKGRGKGELIIRRHRDVWLREAFARLLSRQAGAANTRVSLVLVQRPDS
jgi:hypothetical protein